MNTHRVAGPAEFLALLPHLTGMPIADSVVVVPFTGTRASSAMRVDRDRFRFDPAAAAVTTVGLVCNLEHVDGLALVVSTPNPTREAAADVVALLELAQAADRAGHQVRDLLLVTSEEWVSLTARTRGPLPVVPEVLDGRRLAEPAVAGRLPETEPAARSAADRRREADTASVLAAVHGGGPAAALGLLAATLAGREGAVGLGVVARVGVLRTLALILAGWGEEAAALVWPELVGAVPVGEESFGVSVLLGGPVRRPDAAGLDALIGVAMAAAAGASEEERGDLAAIAAWSQWALGRGSLAARLAAIATGLNPGSDLAASVTTMTRIGRLPEWAFRPDPRR